MTREMHWFEHPRALEVLQQRPMIAAGKNTILCMQGDTTADVSIVYQGTLRVIYYSLNTKITQIDKIIAPCSFGEFSALDGAPRSATVETMTDCKYKTLSAKTFNLLLEENPPIQKLIIKLLLQKFRKLNRQLADVHSATLLQRICIDIYQRHNESAQAIVDVPTQEVWAQELNVQRETLTRNLSSLEETGVIKRTGRKIEIINHEKLYAIFEQTNT